MSSIKRVLTLAAVSMLAAHAAGNAIMIKRVTGGVALTPSTTSAVCGDTVCDQPTCIVDVNVFGCTGQASGFGSNGQVTGSCDNALKGIGGAIDITCSGVSLQFCQKDGTNYVDFRNSDGPSSAVCTEVDETEGYGCDNFQVGVSMCG